MAFKLEDYMEQVEKWFREYEMYNNKTKRQIYLATDDAEVVRLVKPSYTMLHFIVACCNILVPCFNISHQLVVFIFTILYHAEPYCSML